MSIEEIDLIPSMTILFCPKCKNTQFYNLDEPNHIVCSRCWHCMKLISLPNVETNVEQMRVLFSQLRDQLSDKVVVILDKTGHDVFLQMKMYLSEPSEKMDCPGVQRILQVDSRKFICFYCWDDPCLSACLEYWRSQEGFILSFIEGMIKLERVTL